MMLRKKERVVIAAELGLDTGAEACDPPPVHPDWARNEIAPRMYVFLKI